MLPFLDLFQRENVRVDLFKSILHAFINKLVSICSWVLTKIYH